MGVYYSIRPIKKNFFLPFSFFSFTFFLYHYSKIAITEKIKIKLKLVLIDQISSIDQCYKVSFYNSISLSLAQPTEIPLYDDNFVTAA